MKKRVLICLALLAALLMANLVMIQAASASELTFVLNDEGTGYIVSDCLETASGTLSIPETHNGKPVVEIGREAFLNCSKLTGVTIPSGVNTIGWYAFSGCTGLTTLSIPDSVTTIDWFAFSNCSGLTSVVIGDGVTCIDAAVFSGCTNLSTVTLGNGITSIGWSAFKGCTKLTSINIPNSVQIIDRYAFYGCDGLATVTYDGTLDEWNTVTKAEGNEALNSATITFRNSFIAGDVDGDGIVNHNDAIYLLLHAMFGEAQYPLAGAPADIDGNGIVEQDDAVYLLLHTMFGEQFYPLNRAL